MTVPMRVHSPQPWVEKYRPKNLDEIAAQGRVVAVLKRAVEENNLPHLLFYGPPGTGKTSTILAVAKDVFGEHFKERVLELNASDERGIAVVRHKVKDFAKTIVSSSAKNGRGQPCPPYKLIILDEADSMTADAQAALRRTMESYSSTTRFCIICNYVTKIMEPLGSRCAKFRFQPIEEHDAVARLLQIAEAEKFPVEEDAVKFLISFSEGDLRKAINLLQSAHRFLSQQPSEMQALTVPFAHELTGYIDPALIESFLKCTAADIDQAPTQAANIIQRGYSVMQFLSQLHTLVLSRHDITSIRKSLLLNRFSLYEKRLLDGADAELQLLSLAADISEYLNPQTKQVSVMSV